MAFESHYDVLGVARSADRKSIRAAPRRQPGVGQFVGFFAGRRELYASVPPLVAMPKKAFAMRND
jgi:hypothetical protein